MCNELQRRQKNCKSANLLQFRRRPRVDVVLCLVDGVGEGRIADASVLALSTRGDDVCRGKKRRQRRAGAGGGRRPRRPVHEGGVEGGVR